MKRKVDMDSIHLQDSEKPRIVGRKFVHGFVRRHRKDLHTKKGKINSPTRSSNNTVSKTHELIAKIEKNERRWRINSGNVVVFDETVIDDSVTVPLVIGERRKSGDDNNNFVHTRQARLGCFIPFPMLDGTTPLPRFYLQARGCSKR